MPFNLLKHAYIYYWVMEIRLGYMSFDNIIIQRITELVMMLFNRSESPISSNLPYFTTNIIALFKLRNRIQ